MTRTPRALFHWVSIISALVLAASLGACDPVDTPTAATLSAGPDEIVNGTNCTSSTCPAAVGALTSGYAYCSGTLIDASWVLTAAHCAAVWSSSDHFLIGNNESSGTEYATDDAYIHPDYDPDLIINDIALIHLSSPMSSAVATPIPINATALTDAIEGELALYVGFGTTGWDAGDSGIRRYASMEVFRLGEIEYSSRYADTNTGICSGDSGGPGLYDFGSGNRVIGVNSTVSGTGGDECEGYYNDTRVDAYAQWINGYLGDPIPDCNDDIGLCVCNDACGTDGLCDNSACVTDDCGDTYACLAACADPSAACASDCYVTADADAVDDAYTTIDCFYSHCASETTDEAFFDCIVAECPSQIRNCWSVDLCDLLGGDCASTTACRPSTYGFGDCFPTDTAAYGEACTGTATNPTSCGDGYRCLNKAETGSVCNQLCRDNADCTAGGGACTSPYYPMPNNEVGACDDFSGTDTDTDADTDTDTDADTDTDSDSDSDSDSDGDSDTDPEVLSPDDGNCGCSAIGTAAPETGILSLILG